MPFEEKVIMHWLKHFYGYGSWDARYWFVSLDESGGERPEEVADKLNFFYQNHRVDQPTLCNVRQLYKKVHIHFEGPRRTLFTNLHDYRFGSHAVANSIWKNLIAFSYGHEGEPPPDLEDYQKNRLASPSLKREALIRLYPLPSSNDHAWYYGWLQLRSLEFLHSRSRYEEFTFSKRIATILTKVKTHQPEVVLMYGMKKINELKRSIVEVFPQANFALDQAVPRVIPQHHLAKLGGTTFILTTQLPTLRHNRIETGFDWVKFGREVKSKF